MHLRWLRCLRSRTISKWALNSGRQSDISNHCTSTLVIEYYQKNRKRAPTTIRTVLRKLRTTAPSAGKDHEIKMGPNTFAVTDVRVDGEAVEIVLSPETQERPGIGLLAFPASVTRDA